MIIWAPCVMIGIWATSAVVGGQPVIPPDFADMNKVLPIMVKKLASPTLGALLAGGIFAAVMSSLDAQFLSLGSLFTNDIVSHYAAKDRFSEKQLVFIGRVFIVVIVAICWWLGMILESKRQGVFALGVWCFSGFASLFPLLFSAIYWRRVTKAGAYASVLAAAATWFWLFRDSEFGKKGELGHWGFTPVTIIFAAATIALILVSLITPPPSQETINKFFTPSPKPLISQSATPRADYAR
jgi:SSS family solute:Na+ symporter